MTGFFKQSEKPPKQVKDISLEDIVKELESARQIAMLKQNASAMVSATMAKAKLLGLDNGEATNTIPHEIKLVFVEAQNTQKIH